MKTMFQPATVAEIHSRLAHLQPDSERQWGTMNPTQMLIHCDLGIKTATGELRPPRALIGRILGPIIKPLAIGNDKPMRRNSPTAKELIIHHEGHFAAERDRLHASIDRFTAAGPSGCTTYPHFFFGPLTPEQWSNLMANHLDHHLRQFGV